MQTGKKKRKLLHFPHWWHPRTAIRGNKPPSPAVRSKWVRISDNESGITQTNERNLSQFICIYYNRKRQYQIHIENVGNQSGPDPPLLNKTLSPVTSLNFFHATINRLH